MVGVILLQAERQPLIGFVGSGLEYPSALGRHTSRIVNLYRKVLESIHGWLSPRHKTTAIEFGGMAEIWWVSPHTIRSWVRQKKLIPTRICTRLLFAPSECERFLRSMEQCKVTPASVTGTQQGNEGYLTSHVLHNYSTRDQLKSNQNKRGAMARRRLFIRTTAGSSGVARTSIVWLVRHRSEQSPSG
jgi:hypothetical protein